MNLSYWEYQSWISNIDYTIVGSGIVGLNTALHLKNRFPDSRILILERGFLPNGASTKNAGFACFGSLSEILDDLDSHPPQEVVEIIQKRKKGLEALRNNLGDDAIGYKCYGGYELFLPEDEQFYQSSVSQIKAVNDLLNPVFGEEVFGTKANIFGFKNIKEPLIYNKFEAQINTGKMMEALLHKIQVAGIKILNGITVGDFSDNSTSVEVKTDKFILRTKKLLIATNGFASKMGIAEVKPARAQVLITKPIKDLKVKGTFHLDKGYYYFRNIDDRILFGGGRNLDFEAEETTELEQTELVQNKLEALLEFTVLPDVPFEIDHRWSGIMGVGSTKKPLLKQLSKNVYCGVRLGGMGVAIGSLVGMELAEMIE